MREICAINILWHSCVGLDIRASRKMPLRSVKTLMSIARQTAWKKRHFTVGRGPVPRHRSRNATLAGACPPRYGNIEIGRSLLPGRNRDREVSPTGVHRFMKHPHSNSLACLPFPMP